MQAAVLDQGFEGFGADLASEVQSYLEDLIASGLRQRIISLIKVLTFPIFIFFHPDEIIPIIAYFCFTYIPMCFHASCSYI